MAWHMLDAAPVVILGLAVVAYGKLVPLLNFLTLQRYDVFEKLPNKYKKKFLKTIKKFLAFMVLFPRICIFASR